MIEHLCAPFTSMGQAPCWRRLLGGFVLDKLQPHSPTGGINAFRVRLSLSQGREERLGD
jgi:hypothetical protein